MKKTGIVLLLLFTILLSGTFAQSANNDQKYRILLTGASFASKENKWFEMGCKEIGAMAINRAIGGEAIANTANRMAEGTLYSRQELETTDALVIMQVHNKDVFEDSKLLEKYTDYPLPFDRSNYAAAFDYVIKRYISECYELKNDSNSVYFGSRSGKPAIIVLCTDWQDIRESYNTSIRKLAEKWGLPLVEFDRNIGFSKNQKHPVTGQAYSLLYSADTQTVDGIKYGWHPTRGENSYIQQKMAAIFADVMKRILPVKN
ncbi:MAG: DUF5040 domain-containing protein [Bacteroidales bacterium]|nr:DUF5040 domain-containing protein [Bacteroidales bacterium]